MVNWDNPEERREYKNKYYLENKDKWELTPKQKEKKKKYNGEYCKKHYKEHKEEIKQKSKEYYHKQRSKYKKIKEK